MVIKEDDNTPVTDDGTYAAIADDDKLTLPVDVTRDIREDTTLVCGLESLGGCRHLVLQRHLRVVVLLLLMMMINSPCQ